MKLEIGNNQGYAIIDDTTGKILSVFVRNVVEGKFDFQTFSSFTNNQDGTHHAFSGGCSTHAIQQDEDEEAEEMRMRIIMQNGNTGEHYDLLDQE
jgi:hypothetical protein